MALTPDHSSMVIGDTTGNALFFLDPKNGRHAAPRDDQRSLSDRSIALTADTSRLPASLATRSTSTTQPASLCSTAFPASSLPSHINYAPDSSMVFVSLQGTDRLIAIETASGQVVWNKIVGRTPAGVLWNRGHLLVGIMGEAHFAVVDPADGHVERTIPTGRGAHTMFVTHDGKLIYATNRVDGTITVIDPATLAVVRTFACSRRPGRSGFRTRRQDLGSPSLRPIGRDCGSTIRRHRAHQSGPVASWHLAEHA